MRNTATTCGVCFSAAKSGSIHGWWREATVGLSSHVFAAAPVHRPSPERSPRVDSKVFGPAQKATSYPERVSSSVDLEMRLIWSHNNDWLIGWSDPGGFVCLAISDPLLCRPRPTSPLSVLPSCCSSSPSLLSSHSSPPTTFLAFACSARAPHHRHHPQSVPSLFPEQYPALLVSLLFFRPHSSNEASLIFGLWCVYLTCPRVFPLADPLETVVVLRV